MGNNRKGMGRYGKLWENMEMYKKVLESMGRYGMVWKGMEKYGKI